MWDFLQKNECNSKLVSLVCLLAIVAILFVLSLAYFLAWEPKTDANLKIVPQSLISSVSSRISSIRGPTRILIGTFEKVLMSSWLFGIK